MYKRQEEGQYDGFYAVCTDLLDDEVGDILKVSEGRWQIEELSLIHILLFSLGFGKKYVSVELEDENKYEVSGNTLKYFFDMIDPVSYTHLDVYKRQWQPWQPAIKN